MAIESIPTTILFEKGTAKAKPFEDPKVDAKLASGEWFATAAEAKAAAKPPAPPKGDAK